MFLDTTQIQELLNIIQRQHIVFIASNVGKDILSEDDKRVLSEAGINLQDIPDINTAETAFKFGIIADSLRESARNMTYSQLKSYISKGSYIPLTTSEKLALKNVKTQLYGDIKGLGNKISTDFTRIAIEVDSKQRAKYEKLIQKEGEKAILNRSTVREMSSELLRKTEDWSRDFDRIADYVLHTAYDTGIAQDILKKYGEDAKCYKSVYPGACIHCQNLYLTAGIGSKPKIFTISELLKNGSNIGKKVKDWKAIVGATHPFCRCELVYILLNTEWNQELQMFAPIAPKKPVINRQSKVKTTITFS